MHGAEGKKTGERKRRPRIGMERHEKGRRQTCAQMCVPLATLICGNRRTEGTSGAGASASNDARVPRCASSPLPRGGKRSGHASGRRVPFSKASSLCSSARVEGILAAGCPVVCLEKRSDVLSWLIVFVETRERVRWPGLYLLISGSVTSRAPGTVGHPACSLIAYL